MSLTQAIIRKNATIFEQSMDLAKSIERYELIVSGYKGKTYIKIYSEDKSKQLLHLLANMSEEVILPSGRKGNAIALALELHCYKAAAELIKYAKELNLTTDVVVFNEGEDNWSLADQMLYSLLTKCDEPYESDAASFISNGLSEIILPGSSAKFKTKKSIDMLSKSLFDNERYCDTVQVLSAFELYNDGDLSILRKLLGDNSYYRSNDYLLPSGRLGNVLALAFETNNYRVAEYIMDHASEFDMLPSAIIMSETKEKSCETNEEFLYSLLTFEEAKEKKSIEFMKHYYGEETGSKAGLALEEEKAAIERIASKLGLTDKQLSDQDYVKMIQAPTGN